MHPAQLSDEELLKQCDFSRGRGSGPGGQHRNKVETAVVLTHIPTGVTGQASERRSQIENKKLALRRLKLNLAVEVRTAGSDRSKDEQGARPPDEVSSLWRSRRQGTKVIVNPEHADYPALLAEALDAIAAADWEAKPAAEALGVSTSQLIKLVKDHPPAFEKWNRERDERGAHRLK